MRPSCAWGNFALLILSLIAVAAAQQYAGNVIPNSLPKVPGSNITYFLISDPGGPNQDLTLINYYSLQADGSQLDNSQLRRIMIVIHGLDEDPETYMSYGLSALAQVSDPNVNFSTVAIMAPFFPSGGQKGTGYPWTYGLPPCEGSTSNCLVWYGTTWAGGANDQYPCNSTITSSYAVLDQIIHYYDDVTIFPNMNQIVIAGHSLGGQTVQRYAAVGAPGNTRVPVSYWIANPNSYAWPSLDRPISHFSCPIYDVYDSGYTNYTEYPMTYEVSLVDRGRAAILANFNSKQVAYARGILDLGDDSSNCAPFSQGINRNERFFNFIEEFPAACPNPSGTTGADCVTVDLIDAGHDAGQMMASPAGQARLFTDNFYGTHNRAYDFGCPRITSWDNPYPDPQATNCSWPTINNSTVYAGGMVSYGCWTDQNPTSLPNLVYTNNSNTIELCTSTCAQMGYGIAGLEFGTQCFCGDALSWQANQTFLEACSTPCPGNANETCGEDDRLSLYANSTPVVLPEPVVPATINNYTFLSCWTEASSGRALPQASYTGPLMTLDYCATFCQGYQYFGAEYADQ